MRTQTAMLVSVLLGATLILGCSHGQMVRRAPEHPQNVQPAHAATPAPVFAKSTTRTAPAFILKDGAIFFDYDRALLEGNAGDKLATIAKWLKGHPQMKLRIEGNCDERGTDEYNLALGDRRAQSAKEYLERLGVDAERITTVSYGKEKPKALGHDEKSWARNRRDDLRVQ